MTDSQPTYFRVERGNPSAEELAALTVVLLARAAAPAAAATVLRPPLALWRRPERVAGFDGPRTWRRAA